MLDIGCGWGGMALYLARVSGAGVIGITLSRSSFAIADGKRAEEPASPTGSNSGCGLPRDRGPVRPDRLGRDVRACRAVGTTDVFFRTAAPAAGTDDGVMLLHSIGAPAGPNLTSPFIDKYIFPGGYIPALSEVLPAIERAGCWSATSRSCAALRRDPETWRERFLACRQDAERLYDARFVRMWEFDLASSEMAFRSQMLMKYPDLDHEASGRSSR